MILLANVFKNCNFWNNSDNLYIIPVNSIFDFKIQNIIKKKKKLRNYTL